VAITRDQLTPPATPAGQAPECLPLALDGLGL